MKLRQKMMLLAIMMTALPLVVVIMVSGREIGSRFAAQDNDRIQIKIKTVMADLAARDQNLASQLDNLANALKDDNRFRLALATADPEHREYLDSYASHQMSLMRLDMLRIQNDTGLILSSAPLTGSQGLRAPALPSLLANATGGRALMAIRSPEGPFLALVRARPLALGGVHLFLVAGSRLDRHTLAAWSRRNELATAIVWPEGAIASNTELQTICDSKKSQPQIIYSLQRRGYIQHSQALPFISEDNLQDAWLIVTADQHQLHAFIADLQRRLWLLLTLAVFISALLTIWLTRRLTQPLAELAARTSRVDLDRLDVDFPSDRHDEVGELSRLLGQMTDRLRRGLEKLRAAEQRATLGEVARQVNHDIRNGITPLRNVLRHLGEVASDDPAQLPAIFQQRRANLEEGLAYLEQLADRYAQLSPVAKPEPCHLDQIVQSVLSDLQPDQPTPTVTLDNQIPGNLPTVMADPIALRRIFTNLVRNALESLSEKGGRITVDGAIGEDPLGDEPQLLVSISDNGCGIAPENLDRVFQDFFTTRTTGTGLGLSNVRRLVGDLGGNIKVTSDLGRGTTFMISLPLTVPGSR